MRWRGPRTKAWEKARRELKVQFELWDITHCELRYAGCVGGASLGFAHARKRRKLTKEELYEVILVCNTPCHDKIERMPAEEMEAIVKRVIEFRTERLRW